MRDALTPKAQQEIEELWRLRRDAVQVLDLVVAEWQSDPMSVQCFDLNLVQRGTSVIERLRALDKVYGDSF
jgi:hypothetical protein